MSRIIPPDFIIIPYQLIADESMKPVDEKLYGVLYWFQKLKNEKCTASNVVLAELVKTTPGVIQNSLTKLEKNGYIKRVFRDTQKRVRKEIIPLVSFAKVSPTDDRVSPTSDTEVSPTDEQNKKIINKSNKEYSEETSQTNTLIELFKPLNPIAYTRWFSNKTQRGAVERLAKALGDKLEVAINTAVQVNGQPYAPTITTPLQLETKLPNLRAFLMSNKAKQSIKGNKKLSICRI